MFRKEPLHWECMHHVWESAPTLGVDVSCLGKCPYLWSACIMFGRVPTLGVDASCLGKCPYIGSGCIMFGRVPLHWECMHHVWESAPTLGVDASCLGECPYLGSGCIMFGRDISTTMGRSVPCGRDTSTNMGTSVSLLWVGHYVYANLWGAVDCDLTISVNKMVVQHFQT